MSSNRFKGFITYLASFIKPQKLRTSVMVNGEDDAGTVIEKKSSAIYAGAACYMPYPVKYVLIGTEPKKDQPGVVVYRFLDIQTNTEFLLTRSLVDLLFHRTSPVVQRDDGDAMVKDTEKG